MGYLALALACLIQWNGTTAWARVDVFAGTYLALRIAGAIHSILSSYGVFRSEAKMQEWWALSSDPNGPKVVALLMALDLLAFLDYGHWLLVPALKNPVLQGTGLVLYSAVAVCQIWADNHLANFFRQSQDDALPMKTGPYRFVRHPRYTAAIFGKVAFALVLASVIGWVLVLAWAALLLRKIQIEEGHLRKLFGSKYEEYARGTPMLLPRIH
jgi:protein-S-isoprenylcysteine O-methyltransferase